MTKKELELEIIQLRSRVHDLENKLSWTTEELKWMDERWKNIGKEIDCHVNGKIKVMVVDSLSAYRKGKAIKKSVDYISEVLGGSIDG